jgi:C4-dicarboxylate-specific signal transduction histidine kinase
LEYAVAAGMALMICGVAAYGYRLSREVAATQKELELHARRQAAVAWLGRQALARTELADLCQQAAELAAETLQVPYCLVLERRGQEAALAVCAAARYSSREDDTAALASLRNASLSVAADSESVLLPGEPLPILDLAREPRFDVPPWLRELGVGSGIHIRVQGHDRPFGLLAAYAEPCHTFPAENVHFLQAVSNVLTSDIERRHAELRERERDLLRAEQMAAVAQVATGVAHELRNPLTSIKLLVQENLRELASRGMPADDLEIVVQEIRRMERSLESFLEYARPRPPRRAACNLHDIIQRTLALIEGRANRQHVQREFHRPETTLTVEADCDQLQQLLVNLMLNALDAMPHGGMLQIEVAVAAGQVKLSVCDTGPGIAAEILPKLFQPFVTSKEAGLGLGLVVSQRIAEEHGGTLHGLNRPGGGASFVLSLPLEGGVRLGSPPKPDRDPFHQA